MQLQELPADLLRRVLCVACSTPQELLACGAVSTHVSSCEQLTGSRQITGEMCLRAMSARRLRR